MDEKKRRKERRKRQALARLGTTTPACCICGEPDPRCLELHEPGGRRYNQMRVIICRNCHRKLSDDGLDHPPQIWTPPDPLERLSHALIGEADLFARLSEKRREDAAMLIGVIQREFVEPGQESGGSENMEKKS
jgi:hypothetical protein